jgi:hypothetical protein
MPVTGFKSKGKVKGFKPRRNSVPAKLNKSNEPALSAFEPIKIHELKRHGHYWTIAASARGNEPVLFQNKSVAWITVEPDPVTGLFREALPRVAAEFNEHLHDHCRKTNQHPRLTRMEVTKLELAEAAKQRQQKKAAKKPQLEAGKEDKPKQSNPFTTRAARRRHKR